MNYSNHPTTKEFRQFLRKNKTPSECIMWKHLNKKQLDGFRFRQQHGFGPYILDFYCPELRLCIEIDGEIHNSEENQQKDKERTIFLNQNRINVLRFRNEEIENNIDDVIKEIKDYIWKKLKKASVQTPNPLT